ncbi:CBS domain-containing protein [Pseudoroseicyclus tamaricis]|uniref:CBS domain-containing protein n=1 Tax=Pseudoroseicyclus tamaricis TaxID=2705421 RepID=A0A6B2JV14_9RHOB|nr:CBS domain-containing protein [Pseudoroseicyclus tamaricis]NDV00469.1 CBS domain-containing protein [Pseudoroseicyclus tamaricis]
MLVRQILKSKDSAEIVSVAPDKPVADVVQMLSQKRIGAVIVSTDGGAPAGILSERDIVREIGRRGAACLEETAEQMMTAGPVTCTPEDSADAVLQTMTDGRFRHLPVMEGGRLVGLISIGDVVKARLSELAMEKDALEGMIMGH